MMEASPNLFYLFIYNITYTEDHLLSENYPCPAPHYVIAETSHAMEVIHLEDWNRFW